MSTFERAAEAPLVAPTASNPASRIGEVLGVVASDILGGLRHASHHVLAAVGLVAVVVVGFLAGRPDLRHGLEDQTLNWLSARAIQRAEGGVENAPDILLAMAEPEAIQRATATNPAELNRQQAAVAYWIARREPLVNTYGRLASTLSIQCAKGMERGVQLGNAGQRGVHPSTCCDALGHGSQVLPEGSSVTLPERARL